MARTVGALHRLIVLDFELLGLDFYDPSSLDCHRFKGLSFHDHMDDMIIVSNIYTPSKRLMSWILVKVVRALIDYSSTSIFLTKLQYRGLTIF